MRVGYSLLKKEGAFIRLGEAEVTMSKASGAILFI